MKRQRIFVVAAAILFLVAGAYLGRGYLRDVWAAVVATKLPPASRYVATGDTGGVITPPGTSPFEGGYASSENYTMESSPVVAPKPKDPLVYAGVLPTDVNLDVPFTSQAPYSNWNEPYQNACEEASSIMVNAFYQGQTGVIAKADADAAILKLVAYENATYGDYRDTTAAETGELIKSYFGYKTVLVKPFTTAEDLKKILANGYPIIIPAAGKLLHNPNFQNGGPAYHMLVLRGYTKDVFITNDPGTRKGYGYTYPLQTIVDAAHDWTGNEATMTTGKRMMIVVIPNS